MFKPENDKSSGIMAIGATALVEKIDSGSTVYQVTVKTDATVGTLTFSVKARKADDFEPLIKSGAQYVMALSASIRTFTISDAAIKELQAVPAGLNNTFYEVFVSSGGQ